MVVHFVKFGLTENKLLEVEPFLRNW